MKQYSNSASNHEGIGLQRLTPPDGLRTRLRVMASREALRHRRLLNARTFAAYCSERLGLILHNLMKPLAVPAAGGVVSTIVLFALLAPALTVNRNVASDIPTGLTTPASLESSFSFHLTGEDVVVDVNIDEGGRVTSYSIPRGQHWTQNPAMVRGVETTLLHTKFIPATMFGQPATGKTRITLRRSSLDVRG